ncbi:DUF3015 family protein [Anaeromyxobacter diazotrophicus]|uniref:DUF3015 domain-containing protein n=1 Tax=Anaeromyxobacter diazotrophicus TaxID=2590199 RepID=A0A7I9VRC6_9BACT|nr:DUF3015 family protein [Anaeromyxobacter diazotrophicus]GEJ58973.1 hypothetical protein AMYX_37140 [Anaeromyxobacter diazotrophicus]
MRRVLVALFVMGLSISTYAEAKSTEAAIRGTKGRYGDAGCGLGSMAFGDQQGAIQILAATTNGTFGNQTFGITTGTSNCSGLSGAQATRLFIEVNREALAKDISRGSGETIGTLTWLNGCTDSNSVGATLQKNFSAIFPSESVSTDAVTEAVIKTLKDEKMLACQNLG